MGKQAAAGYLFVLGDIFLFLGRIQVSDSATELVHCAVREGKLLCINVGLICSRLFGPCELPPFEEKQFILLNIY